MKKSIKYAGIAAATLLAVAPVAAPVLSVQAAETESVATDQSKQNDAVTAFGNQFGDVKAADLVSNGALKNPITLGSQKLSDFAANNEGLITTPATLDNMNNLIGSDATVSVSAKYGSTSINQADLAKILSDETYPEVDFTITLNYNNLNNQAVSKTYTVKAERTSTDIDELTSVNAKFTTPISVALDSTTTSTQLTATTDIKLTDQNGDGVVAGTVKPDTNYYNTYKDAMDGNTANATQGVENGKFVTSGTYYQAISFTAGTGSSLSQFITNYSNDPASYTVYVNGAKASEGYDFKNSTDNNTLTFVRAINVSNSTDKWTVSDTTGVVTTKSDHSVYTLKDGDNNTIVNRGLAANTAWKTDKVRVNQDGVKQYRVATNEWINADDVNYGETVTSNGLTDIKAASGVATLTKPAGYVMSLFGDDGNVLDRGLASGTAWRVDKTAKDAAGNTYYRVATGEWLQAGEGVSFK